MTNQQLLKRITLFYRLRKTPTYKSDPYNTYVKWNTWAYSKGM